MDIVYTAPGMKDFITVWENDKKQRLRKYYSTAYLCEAHSIFKAKHPDVTIGYPAFCKKKPQNVLLLKNTPLDQCRCEKHENFFFKLTALKIITIFGNNVYARGIQKILWLFVGKVHVCNAPKGKRYYLTTLIYPKPWNIKSGFLMMNKSDAASKDPPTTANLFTCYFYQVFPAPETSKGYRNQALSKSNQNLILYWFRLTLQRHTPVSTRIKYKAPSGIEVQ